MPELLFVVLMGVGTVFFGLICIIVLSTAMSAVCRSMGETPAAVPAAQGGTNAAQPAAVPVPAARNDAIPNRQAMIAAISAAIAEEEGADLNAIRILSVKKL